MSPVFKSDAAKEIIQEVGVGTNGHRKIHRRSKKRSMTITSSHPSMLEALQNHNEKVCILDRIQSCRTIVPAHPIIDNGLKHPKNIEFY